MAVADRTVHPLAPRDVELKQPDFSGIADREEDFETENLGIQTPSYTRSSSQKRTGFWNVLRSLLTEGDLPSKDSTRHSLTHFACPPVPQNGPQVYTELKRRGCRRGMGVGFQILRPWMGQREGPRIFEKPAN